MRRFLNGRMSRCERRAFLSGMVWSCVFSAIGRLLLGLLP